MCTQRLEWGAGQRREMQAHLGKPVSNLTAGRKGLGCKGTRDAQAVMPGEEGDLAEYMKPVTVMNDKGVHWA